MYYQDKPYLWDTFKSYAAITRGSGKTYVFADAVSKAVREWKERDKYRIKPEIFFVEFYGDIYKCIFQDELNIKVSKQDLITLLEE